MKAFHLICVVLCLWINATLLLAELPVLESSVLNTIDLDKDGVGEIVYKVVVGHIGGREDYLGLTYYPAPSENARLLRASTSIIPFEPTQTIGNGNPDYQFQGSSSGDLPLTSFTEELVFPNWYYFDLAYPLPEPFFTNKTSFVIGFRAELEDGRHYGWLSFSRPDVQFTTAFALDSWNWNPVPNAPIQAGLPPEIPLTTSLVNQGEGRALRIEWPEAIASWSLESTTNLLSSEGWEAYPAGGTWVEVPLDEEAEPFRYFRMRQP